VTERKKRKPLHQIIEELEIPEDWLTDEIEAVERSVLEDFAPKDEERSRNP
jgi:hypothetical protein